MLTQLDPCAAGAEQRAEIENALARYPDISPDSLAAIITWFRKEASALDVALIASNEVIAESYRRFRTDHIDPFTPGDLAKGFIFVVTALGLTFIALIWPAL